MAASSPPIWRFMSPYGSEGSTSKDEFNSVLSPLPSVSSACRVDCLCPEPVDWARLKRWARLQQLLASDTPGDVNACDAVGRTALHYASGYGERTMAAALIRHGATVDAPDRFGVTPLHWACLKAHVPLVHLLLSASADPLRQATKGVFSRHSAIDLAIRADAQEPGASKAVTEALTSALGGTLFEQRKVLGRGGFGTVIKAVRRDTGHTVALKEIRKTSGAGEDNDEASAATTAAGGGNSMAVRGARVERDVLSAVSHPFVVTLHCAYQTRHHLYLALDYCGGGDLALHIRHGLDGRLPESTSRFVCAEVLLGVEALHEAGVIHRDLKAENVLVDAYGHIRLADMNAAKLDSELTAGKRTYSVVGTPFAAAPEVLQGKTGYSFAADWWSYGVLLFECLSGRPPYPKDQELLHAQARLVHEIIHGERAPLPEGLSEASSQLVDGLLERNEALRLSRPDELRAHGFFEGIDWSLLLAKQIPSPLLPENNAPAPTDAAAAASAATSQQQQQQQQGPGLDVFAYPSILSPTSNGSSDPMASVTSSGGFGGLGLTPRVISTGGLDGWDYVLGAGEGSGGERLWRRIRSRVDQLARLQRLSRAQFLTCLILKLAGDDGLVPVTQSTAGPVEVGDVSS